MGRRFFYPTLHITILMYCYLSLRYEEFSLNPALPMNMLEYAARKGTYAAFQTIVNINLIWIKYIQTYNLRESPHDHDKTSHS